MHITNFKWINSRPAKPISLVGIDIGTTGVKLLELGQTEPGSCQVINYALTPLPAGVVVERNIKDFATAAAILRQTCAALGFQEHRAVMALPDSLVMTKIVQIAADAKILEEAQYHIPYPIEEVSLDFQILGASPGQPEMADVLLVVARKNHVETRRALAAESGLKLVAIEAESHAIERWNTLAAKPLLPAAEDKIVAIIDLGATTMTLTLLRNGHIIFTHADVFLENHQAQKDTILLLLRRALQFFSSSYPQEQVAYLVITGGGGLLPGLAEFIQDQLNIPAFVPNSFSAMKIAERVDQQLLASVAPRLTLSCGLALRVLLCP